MDLSAWALTAAGQDIPEEWNHHTRPRWYDLVVAYAVVLVLAALAGQHLGRPLNRLLKQAGLPGELTELTLVPVCILAGRAIATRIVSSIQHRRQLKLRR